MVTGRGLQACAWRCVAVVAALATTLHAQTAAAQAPWPAHTVRLVVAQAPGAPPDIIARYIAQRLGPQLGTSVVVQNIPGASGTIGAEQVARAAPDGATLLIATLSTHALVPHTQAVRYDPLADFTPVANLFRSVKALWVNAALPVANATEFLAYARARPGELNYASGGVGSSNDIDARIFLGDNGIAMVQVPYNGPAAAIAGVATGAAQMMVLSLTAGLPLAQAGRVRPLLVFAAQRSPLLPDTPTATEAGVNAHDLDAWIGLVGPAGMPDALVLRLHAAVDAILASDETRQWAQQQGLAGARGSSAAFAATIATDHARWRSLIRALQVSELN
jgi:tripartite-type tricarboxylate transporter receptor subunit TctC